MAFAGLQLLRADGSIRGDRENQIVDLFLALEIGFVRLVADDGIRLVGDEGERAGAERLLVELRHLAVGGKLVGIFLGDDRGEVHGQVGEERRFGMIEGKLDGEVIDLLDRLDQLGKAHAGGVFVRAALDILVPRIVSLELALEREDDVVGIEVTRRREEVGGLVLDARMKLEGVFRAVGGNAPAVGQARLDLGPAMLEFDEAAIDRARRRVEGRACRIEARVEAFRRALGAINKSFGCGSTCHQPTCRHCERCGRNEFLVGLHVFHLQRFFCCRPPCLQPKLHGSLCNVAMQADLFAVNPPERP